MFSSLYQRLLLIGVETTKFIFIYVLNSGRTTGAASCRGLCKAWTCPGTFQKVSGHNHGGVIVYHYYIGSDPECGQTCFDIRDSRVLIIQNTSNCDIATEVFTNDIENSECKCSLCSEILRHTCEMLRDLIIIKKHEIRGICNNCKICHTTCNKCAQCNEVMKSFMNNQCLLGQRSPYCRLQSWFRKIRDTLNVHQGQIVPERQRDLLEITKSQTGFREPDVSELFSEDAERNLLKSEDNEQHPSQIYGTKNIPGDDNFKDETHKDKSIGKSKGYPSRTRSLDAHYEKKETLKKGAPKDDRGSKGAKKSTTPQSPLQLKSQEKKTIKGKSRVSKSEADMHGIDKNKPKTKNKDSGKEKSDFKDSTVGTSKSKDKDSTIAQKKLDRAKDKGGDGKSKDKDSDIAQRKLDRAKEKSGDGKSKDKDSDKAQRKLDRTKENDGDVKSKDKDSDIAQRKLDRAKEKGGDVKSKDKDSDIAQKKIDRAKEKGGDGKSKDKDSDIAQRKLDRAKEKGGDGKSKDKDSDIAQKNLDRAKEKGGDGKSEDKDADIAQRKLDRAKEKGGDGKSKDKDSDTAQKKLDKAKEKDADAALKESKRKEQAAADDTFNKMMKEAKELAAREKDMALKKKKQEEAELKQKLKGAQEPPPIIPVKPPQPIKATPSQILRFREKADEQRNRITGADGKHKAKSLMSSFNDEIYRKLSLDRLPVVGQVYKCDGPISPVLGSITSVNTSDKNKITRFKPPKHKIKLPALGVREDKTRSMEYRIIRIRPQDNRKKTENEIKYVMLESDDELDYNLERSASAPQQYEIGKMIVGSKMCKYKPNSEKVLEPKLPKPLLFKVLDIDHSKEFSQKAEVEDINEVEQANKKKTSLSDPLPKGIVRYELSDRQFIDKGWTMLPTEKIVRKMNMYRMRPVRPEFGWFKRNKHRCPMSYHSGEELAVIDDDGNGRWFYRNGQIAMDYHVAEETNTQQRYVVYSLGKPDDRHPQRAPATTVLACFDWLGNGVVYDHSGQVRLKYNQTEGVLRDKSLGPATHWKWHTLNDPPVLQQIMIDTELPQKDPEILNYGQGDSNSTQPEPTADNEEMLAIELENFVKEKSKKLSQKFKPYQIRMKALKINDQFSLRVLDQASVYLLFRDGQNNLKLNLGMVLDPREIVDTETMDVGEVSSSYDRLPAQTASIAHVQQMIMNAKQRDKCRTDLMQRIKRPERQLSVEQLKSAVYKPRELTSGPEYFYL